jgi:ABC-type amino acid transport substrate-binding protein
VGIILLSFWFLPGLISAFTDIPQLSIFRMMRDALIISVSTTLSILALPYINKMTKSLLDKHNINDPIAIDIIETTSLVSYPFGQIGNFFVYLFVLFCCVYYNHPINQLESWLLPFISYLSSIGSPDTTASAINFLAKWLQMHSETITLYDNLTLVTNYGQVLASVMSFATLTILVTFASFGFIKIRIHKILLNVLLGLLLLIIFVHFFKHFIPNPGLRIYQRINAMTLSNKLTDGIEVSYVPLDETKVVPVKNTEDSLTRIQRTGVLRVGYNATQIRPFAFFNTQGQLVGYDIANMYVLARLLKARLVFVPYTWPNLIKDIQGDKFDIAITVWASATRLESAQLTDPYIKDWTVFIVPRNRQNEFSSSYKVRSIPQLRLGAFNDPYVTQVVQSFLPNVYLYHLTKMGEIAPAFVNHQIDAVIWDQITANIWALKHPGYAVVSVPGMSPVFLMAYMVQNNSPQFRTYVNYWLQLLKEEGIADKFYDQWMLGHTQDIDSDRWNLINFAIKRARH